MEQKVTAKVTLQAFCRAWFEDRNLGNALEYLMEDVQFIGTGDEEEASGIDVYKRQDMQYVNRGYGIGESKDGILFLLDMGSREWAISTNGAAMTMFSDYDLTALGDHAASGYFSSDQYYEGFRSYLKELDKTLDRNLNPQQEESELGKACLLYTSRCV